MPADLRIGQRRRARGFCNTWCGRRTVALVIILCTGATYYLRIYHGMILHLELPGGFQLGSDHAGDSQVAVQHNKPIKVPRFDNLHIREYDFVPLLQAAPAKSKPKEIRPSKTDQKPAKPPAAKVVKTRRSKGTVEYLRSTNVTFLYVPSLPVCVNSRLIFAVATGGATVVGETREQAAKQRQAVRETWASNLGDLSATWRGCAVFYALVVNPETEKALLLEAKYRQDIIVLAATNQTVEGWQPHELDVVTTSRVLFYLAATQHSASYVVRTNHKAFWNVKKLVSNLREVGNDTRRLAGKLLHSDWVHRDPMDPAYTSRSQFPDQMYPESTLNDPGYVVSTEALRAMDKMSETTPLVFFRDMYITGILRTRVKAELDRLDDIKISKAYPVSPCHFRIFAATPTVEAEEMHKVWARFIDANHKCSYTLLNEEDLF